MNALQPKGEPPERTALYRLYDASERLLYVGISNNLQTRWHHHTISKPWWHLVTRRDIQWHPDRTAADAAETEAIVTEEPLFNIDKVPRQTLRTGYYDDTADRKKARRLLRRDAKRHYFHVGRTVHITVLAERYEVSARTLYSEIMRGNEHCFSQSRMRITILYAPKF
ncbi:GIY-YIG nuclease family protein [Streptomyces sp. NPDC059258]|uniref:GIY-YIG nuclease family protein n=1 Tax=unclassified Streptomyces TaxID=2593676 RepID=UPI0036A4514C